jgi:hypothetical protein
VHRKESRVKELHSIIQTLHMYKKEIIVIKINKLTVYLLITFGVEIHNDPVYIIKIKKKIKFI